MPRPFTRTQALQNAAFLAALRETGNAREAARRLGVHRSTYTKRRASHPAFAAEWDAALTIAHAALNKKSPSPSGEGLGWGSKSGRCDHPDAPPPAPPLKGRGESPAPQTTRLANGRLQLRRAHPRRLTRSAEQAFLAALSATANVRLSAAAAGFTHSAFYARKKASPAFAREWRLALETGYERVELALLESWRIESHADDAWRHNDPPPIPKMSPGQALQLLYLHQKEARLWTEPDYIKRRRGESKEAHSIRLGAMYEARLQRDREAFDLAEAARRERQERSPFEPDPPTLPALDQVTGWSKADPNKPPHNEDRALFGGWRIEDWE